MTGINITVPPAADVFEMNEQRIVVIDMLRQHDFTRKIKTHDIETNEVIELFTWDFHQLTLDDHKIKWVNTRSNDEREDRLCVDAMLVVQRVGSNWIWCYNETYCTLLNTLIEDDCNSSYDERGEEHPRKFRDGELRIIRDNTVIWRGDEKDTLHTYFGHFPNEGLTEEMDVEVFDVDCEGWVAAHNEIETYVRLKGLRRLKR